MAQPACTLITGPTAELLDALLTKEFLRLDQDYTAENSFLNDEIAAARQRFERVTGRTLLTSTYLLNLDGWPWSGMVLVPRSPLRTVTSIVYTAADGTATTLAANQYDVDIYSEPGRIRPAYGVSWPGIRSTNNAVRITFTAGYATAAEIPDVAEVRSRMRACVGYCWRNREERDERLLDRLFESLMNGVMAG